MHAMYTKYANSYCIWIRFVFRDSENGDSFVNIVGCSTLSVGGFFLTLKVLLMQSMA